MPAAGTNIAAIVRRARPLSATDLLYLVKNNDQAEALKTDIEAELKALNEARQLLTDENQDRVDTLAAWRDALTEESEALAELTKTTQAGHREKADELDAREAAVREVEAVNKAEAERIVSATRELEAGQARLDALRREMRAAFADVSDD